MSFAEPRWLLLLLLLPLVPYLAARSREEPAGARRSGAAAVRVLLLLLVVMALSGASRPGTGDRLTTVFVVDASASIAGAGRAEIDRFLAAAREGRGEGDRAAVVVFAGEALVEAAPAPDLPLPPYASRPEPLGSDAGAAVALASALFDPGGGKRIVLLSDGEENKGSLLAAVAGATASGIDVRLVPIAARRADDARVEALAAPAVAARGEPFDLRLAVRTATASRARLRYYEGRELLAEDDVELTPGPANLFSLRVAPGDSGLHTFRAEVVVAGDAIPENNAAEATVEVRGSPSVLLAGARSARLEPAAAVLRSAGIDAEVVGIDGVPRSLIGLRRHRLVALADVAAEDLGEETMALLAAYVRDAGGSLIMTGGERSFGPGGYLGTAIEQVLPVTMEVNERRYFPTVALVAAIDKSGSMAGVGKGQKIEVAKAGAAAAIEVLDETDQAGVVGFDAAAQWVARLRSLSDRKSILHELATLRAGGGTDIYPAMEEAFRALAASDRRVKHLILLSDGQSPPRDYRALAARMAAEGITVTTVAVGADADTYTMKSISEAGKGRAYVAEDPALLPRIFTKEALTVQRSFVVEETFQARLRTGHEVLAGVSIAAAPPLHGYVATYPRPQALTLLVSHRGDPILSLWRTGLGKSAALTIDVGGPWSRDWASWRGWGQILGQLVRWSVSGQPSQGLHVGAGLEASRIRVAADYANPGGEFVNFARLVGAVVGPDGARREVRLKQTAPGRYEGTVAAAGPGAYLVSVREAAEGGGEEGEVAAGSTTVDVPYSAEFRPAADGRGNLERVAAATGAHLGLDPARAFSHDLPFARQQRPLRPLLLWLLPFALLLDVAARRVSLPDGWWARAREWLGVRLRRPRRPVDSTAALARLRSVKASVAKRQAAAGEVAPPGDLAGPAATTPPATPPATLPAAPPTSGGEPAAVEPAEPAPGQTAGRLLEAKRRRRQP